MLQTQLAVGDDHGTDSQPSDAQADRRMRTEMTRICAWCRRVHMPDGTWQPGRRATDYTMPTHGICPDCSEKNEL